MTTAQEDEKRPQPPVRGYAVLRAEDGQPDAAPTLYLYDILGVDFCGGIAARQVVDDLAALGPVDALDVRINSPGGDVFEGIAIYNAIARFPAKVTVHVDGLAASAASLVAMAGEQTLVAENAMFMIHRPYMGLVGDAEELRRQAEVLDKAWASMQTTYARRTGRRAATFEQKVAENGGEWWLTAAEAVAEGLDDAVETPEKAAQVFGLHRFKKVPAKLAASAAKDDGLVSILAPRVAEIAAPRVEATPREVMPRAMRRRIVEALRLA